MTWFIVGLLWIASCVWLAYLIYVAPEADYGDN